MSDDLRAFMERVWLNQCKAGTKIPRIAIVEYDLEDKFDFTPVPSNGDFYTAKPKQVINGAACA